MNGKIDEDVVLRIAFPFMLAIAIAMMSILVGHIKLIIAGYTTVEKLSRPGDDSKSVASDGQINASPYAVKNPFDHGPKKNLQNAMGTSLLRFVVPLPVYPDPILRQTYGQRFKDI